MNDNKVGDKSQKKMITVVAKQGRRKLTVEKCSGGALEKAKVKKPRTYDQCACKLNSQMK